MSSLMIYGATGYTGRIASENAKRLGLKTLLAGRTESSLKELALSLDLPYRVFNIDAPKQLATALKDVSVVLNCAGPFHRTAEPLIDQCLRGGVHYLDISAELDSYRIASDRDEEAREANVLLMPGCGGSVAMLGCLAGHVVDQMDEPPRHVDVALHVAGSMSRGSIISARENMTTVCLQRKDGLLVEQNVAELVYFDFGDGKGEVACVPVTLPDLYTIWRSTGAQNVKAFVHASGIAFSSGDLDSLPPGPGVEEREANPYHAAVTSTARDGTVRKAVLHTVNGYTFTAVASVEAARRVMSADVMKRGYQTPAECFGNSFVDAVVGSMIHDV